ncbi:hypothetical protein JQ581_30080 [Bradyrhizobium liaoningense]|uniref:hypothetical protein n=1 Tax=Bradyrhizobium liaoningense TaxID=43992 RepID=UPI001BABDEC4|nr:hypothetical protein [Bradyrhizobium liaoningense]MBR0741189.1 hypothetical protein [Bradyrhizobium liaoningense]
MTSLSDLAAKNALQFEVKKDGLTQRQSGDWQLRFTIAAIDMDQRLAAAPMGTRFACVMVEINDDETPVDHKAEERDKWAALGPTTQAGIRCKEPPFWRFLEEEHHYRNIQSEAHAAECVRHHCGVASRSDFSKPGRSDERQRWYRLDYQYQAWRVKEGA